MEITMEQVVAIQKEACEMLKGCSVLMAVIDHSTPETAPFYMALNNKDAIGVFIQALIINFESKAENKDHSKEH